MTFPGSRRWMVLLKSPGITQARVESVNWRLGSGTVRGTFSASVNRCAEAVSCRGPAHGGWQRSAQESRRHPTQQSGQAVDKIASVTIMVTNLFGEGRRWRRVKMRNKVKG